MRVVYSSPSDGGMYFVLRDRMGRRRVYRISVSLRKFSAQMAEVKGHEAEILLREFERGDK